MRCRGIRTYETHAGICKKNCGRPAKFFYKVHYSELDKYYGNGKYEDAFGFCEECAQGKDKPQEYKMRGWRHQSSVLNLRGIVSEVQPCYEQDYKIETVDMQLHDTKREILRIMAMKHRSSLALNQWQQIFKLALDEYTVISVMQK